MKVFKTLFLVSTIVALGACSVLKEQNQGGLASTSATLYAFFETVAAGSVGCYPDAANNNSYSPINTLRAVYSFQVERPTTLVVCVKVTAPTPTDANYDTMRASVLTHTIAFFATNSKVQPGNYDLMDYVRIPMLGGSVQSVYLLGGGGVCPFDPDTSTFLVGRFDMDNLMDYQYITAADDSCGSSVGTGMSPFALAKKYGVTY
jgi:hypothetical protein